MSESILSVREFAEANGLSPSTVYRWLNRMAALAGKPRPASGLYLESELYEAMRRARMTGTRDVRGKLNVNLRPLKIAGFPDHAVNEQGHIFNVRTGRRLTARTRTDGYKIVDLGGGYGTQYVHRLVCAAHHNLPFRRDFQVDHLNGNKGDNRPENLEWTTGKQNLRRRDKKHFVHPNQPFKFTQQELGIITTALARGLTFGEFRREYPQVAISQTHYRRKRIAFGAPERVEWSSITPDKRYFIAHEALNSPDFFHVEFVVNTCAAVPSWDFTTPLTIGEYLLMCRWMDFMELRKLHRAAVSSYAIDDPRSDRRLQRSLRQMTDFDYIELRPEQIWLPALPTGKFNRGTQSAP